jgi:beta-mannosidase
MDLSGTWAAAPVDEALRRSLPDPDLDDTGWATLPVPGHWRSSPAFSHHDEPVLYRRRFEAPRPRPGRRAWLTLEGVFYQSDVWLDGSYLGETEGYFFPHTFEVTGALTERTEHALAVEVACPRPRDLTAKRSLTGVFQHWDCLDPDWNPGGLWRPVGVSETGPVRIARLRVLCSEASAERAVLEVRAVLDAAGPDQVLLHTTVGSEVEHSLEHPVAAGENRVSWRVVVERPRLWWPHALGDQPLYQVAVAVRSGEAEPGAGEADGAAGDRRVVEVGLRQVRMRRWILTVNGERLFLKGSNQGPTRMQLGEATAAELERDVSLARQAGLDLLRVHAHVSRPELYRAADRAGLLLWQDLPLQWGYARTVRREAARQAREAVDLLGHHPSIAIWCGHNEPFALALEPGSGLQGGGRLIARFLAAQELPTYNRTILDASVKRSLDRADPTRPVIAHSGVLPHPGSGGTDSHLYFGWYHGKTTDLGPALAAFPRLARFPTEFGAQAVPDSDEFVEPERWPDLDWARLGRTHALQRDRFDRYVPPSEHEKYEDWKAATQAYQADLVRHHVETLRRLKYRPTGGFCQFCFGDGHPAVTWSVLDHRRVPKAGYHALAAACAPVIVVADRPAPAYAPGQAVNLQVHVVSDLRQALPGATVTARLSGPELERDWRWVGDVPADSCVRVGTVRATAPDRPGPLVLELDVRAGEVVAANRYTSTVAPG